MEGSIRVKPKLFYRETAYNFYRDSLVRYQETKTTNEKNNLEKMNESGTASDLDRFIDLLIFSVINLTYVKQLTEPQIQGKSVVFNKKCTYKFLALCRKVEEILINESIVQKVGYPVMICDNVHKLSKLFWYDFRRAPDTNFIFIGNYYRPGIYILPVVLIFGNSF